MNDTLYTEIAERLAGQISAGAYAPGERVPSVRALAKRWRVGVNTVVAAYRLLDARGVLAARPQAGYFVQASVNLPAEPAVSQPRARPTHVGVDELVLMLLKDRSAPGILALSTAVPNADYLPLDKLSQALIWAAKRTRESVAYDFPPGCRELRVQVAKRATRAGCALHPDHLVTTNGGQEAFLLCLSAMCVPGDTVAVESPTYYGILQILQALRLKALEIPTHPREGMSIEALKLALRDHRLGAVIAITNGNNPLGSIMPDERKRELVALLAQHQIPLIEDDIYGDLHHDGERPSVAKAHDRHGLVALCSSVSKALAPGWRVGWVAGGRWHERIAQLKAVFSMASASPTQLAMARFFDTGGYDRFLAQVRPRYARTCALMAQAIGRAFPAGTRITRPVAGFVLWIELPSGVDALALYETALRAGISVAPGPVFSPAGGYRSHVRLTAACWGEREEAAVRTLGDLVGKLAQRAQRQAARSRAIVTKPR